VDTFSKSEQVVMEIFSRSPTKAFYGLEIVEQSEGQLKRGTVYITLSNLEDRGYLESRLDMLGPESKHSLPRRLYTVTGIGQRAHAQWRINQDNQTGLATGLNWNRNASRRETV
jgi:DNA-binding PadR family transcriptional regulator